MAMSPGWAESRAMSCAVPLFAGCQSGFLWQRRSRKTLSVSSVLEGGCACSSCNTTSSQPDPDCQPSSVLAIRRPPPASPPLPAAGRAALSLSPSTRGYFLCSQRHVAIKRQQPGVREGAAGARGTVSLRACQKGPAPSPSFWGDGASLKPWSGRCALHLFLVLASAGRKSTGKSLSVLGYRAANTCH